MKPKHSLMLLSLATVIGTSLPVQACSYDGQFNNPFTESFPGSLDVAIATQSALEGNQLNQIEKLDGNKGLRRASWWLKLMVEQHADEFESVSYIYLVDSHLWSKVNQGNQIEIHSTPPKPNNQSTVMLLSEAALYALVNDKTDFENAARLGIVHHY
ncbi:hypothetical protein L4C33_04055 [Vibrio makurazakiensis]|uniref:hypothetical protein n=1 Tax=Vibrio makurazakiensis TaxID=2910250 RepID=UPI003D09F192